MDTALTIKDVAEILQLHPLTVYKLARTGELPGKKIGGSWRFAEEGIANLFFDKRTNETRIVSPRGLFTGIDKKYGDFGEEYGPYGIYRG